MEFKLRKIERKGDLTNNFLSLVIAVIGIGLIIFGIVKLYQLRVSEEEKNARNFLDSVIEKVDALGKEKSNEFVFQGFNGAEEWELHGFDLSDEDRPDECFFESCLCVCDKRDDCKSARFCENVNFENVLVRTDERFDRENVFLGVDNVQDGVICEEIELRENLFKLNIEKEKNYLTITDNSRVVKTNLDVVIQKHVPGEQGVCVEILKDG